MLVSHPVAAFFAALLVLVPLPWHYKSRNIATVSIVIWLFILNFLFFVNSLVWSANVRNPAPVYCDIVSKLIVGSISAIPAAALCIAVDLEFIASARRPQPTEADIRRKAILESSLCFGLPALFMILQFVVQDHRFDILGDFGCQPAVYNSVAALFLVWLPPIFLAAVALVFCGLALRHFLKRRMSFESVLQISESKLTTSQFFRLISMSVAQVVWSIIINALRIHQAVSEGLKSYPNWAAVHSDFSKVDLLTLESFAPKYRPLVNLFWWSAPVSAFIFFAFFAFGQESRMECRAIFKRVHVRLFKGRNGGNDAKDAPPIRRPIKRLVLSTFGSLGRSTLRNDPLDPYGQLKNSYPLTTDLFSQPLGGDKIPKDISEEESDKVFTQITLDYLQTPTGQAAEQLSRMSSQRFNKGRVAQNYSSRGHGRNGSNGGLRRADSTTSSTMSKYSVAGASVQHRVSVSPNQPHSIDLSRATVDEESFDNDLDNDEVYTETYMFGGRSRTRVVGRTAGNSLSISSLDGEIPIYFPETTQAQTHSPTPIPVSAPQPVPTPAPVPSTPPKVARQVSVVYHTPFTGPSVVPMTPSKRTKGIPFTVSTTQVRDSYYR